MTESTGREWMYQKVFVVFLCILACAYYYTFFIDRTQVGLEIEVSQKTSFKLYWSDDNRQFSEKDSASLRLTPSQNTYEFSVSGLGGSSALRFDPIQYDGEALVKRLTISQKGYKTIDVDLKELQPLNQIDNIIPTAEGITFSSTGNDPFFQYIPHFEKESVNWSHDLFMMAAICLLLIIMVSCCASLRADFGYVPVMMSMVLMLVIIMASASARNVHPDEYVHLAATSYYEDNWLPPAIEDEAIEDTYSVYGMSRLNNGEIYYLLAGKSARIFKALDVDGLRSLRSFNVLLFFLIVLYTVRSIPARAVALPFLISPQIWYIFSYCNSDAFALFICFLAGCELVRSGSLLNKALESDRLIKRILPTVSIALLLGLLFLLKKNYYPFIALFYFCLLVRIIKSDNFGSRSTIVFRIMVLTVFAVGFAGIRIGMDYHVNGLDRQEKILTMQEKTARKIYKPSTDIHEKHIYLHKKDRGIPLKSLIVKDKWFAKTFQSGFGKYGYFTIEGPATYYEIVKWFASILLIYFFATIFIRGSSEESITALITALLSVALIGVSLYHSWTMDFQAQGRYLFPIICMFGILLGRCRQLFDTRLFILSVSQLYFLGLYSFIFIALVNIPRM